MINIKTCDITLCALAKQQGVSLSFKETLEAAKLIEKAGADVLQLPMLGEDKKDAVTARSIASTLTQTALAIECKVDIAAAERTIAVLKAAKNPRLELIVPVSTVQMEYLSKMKPDKLLSSVEAVLDICNDSAIPVAVTMEDATRGDKDFYTKLIALAVAKGVKTITVSDTAGVLLPDEAKALITDICALINDESVSCGFAANNNLGVASANAAFAVQGGAKELKLAFNGMGVESLSIEQWAKLMRTKGDAFGIISRLNMAELQRLSKRLESIVGVNRSNPSPFGHIMDPARDEADLEKSELGEDTDIQTLSHRIEGLGYDLGGEELEKLYEEFRALAAKKKVYNKDLEALVADMARQIPPTYKLLSYVVNSGSGISATACIKLGKLGEAIQAVSYGDGPVDASFMALEQIMGHHYELEEFHIQAVTEGREAIGDAFIKLRYNGKLYAGRGIDTDVIGSCIRAYINAVNKILYEEKQ